MAVRILAGAGEDEANPTWPMPRMSNVAAPAPVAGAEFLDTGEAILVRMPATSHRSLSKTEMLQRAQTEVPDL